MINFIVYLDRNYDTIEVPRIFLKSQKSLNVEDISVNIV